MTQLKSLITPTALLAAFTLAAAPSFAQEHGHGREHSSGQASSHQQSAGQSRERAQPRSEAPRPQGGAAPSVQSRQQAPRVQQQPLRQAQAPRAQSRANDSRQFNGNERRNDYNGNNVVGRAVPRGSYSPRYEPRYDPRYAPRYSPRGYGYEYGARSYYRPYVFRPRFSIGFGIFAGYPVPYTYSYPYPIEVYGYGAPAGPVTIAPGASAYGGVALEITPPDADVFVDGQYAGKVQDFDGTTQPLTLTPGTHKIEVQAPGYEPMIVDVGVQPGQIIPYRGDLRPY